MEKVIIQSGPCGCFQIIHIFLTQSTRFVLAWSVNFMMFGNFDPGWRCVPRDVTNKDINVTENSASLLDSRSTKYTLATTSNWKNSSFSFGELYLNNFKREAENGTMNSYKDSCRVIDKCRWIEFNPSSSTIVSEFGLVCDKTWIISFIIFMQFIGMFTGSLVWGQIGERFGRKISVYASTALLGVFNMLSVFCSRWEMYLVCSIFVGVSGVGILTCVPVYSMEFLSPKWRGIYASLPVWNLASCCFAGIVIALKNWWHIHIVNAVMTTFVCLGFFWVPESLRWLAVNGEKDKAVKVVRKMARVNKKPMPNMDAIETLRQEDENSNVKTYTYLDLFRTKDLGVIVIKLSICFIIAICTYNTLGFGVYSLPGNFYVNFIISSCSEIPGVMLVGFLANQIGRRWAAFTMSFVQALCFSVIVLVSATPVLSDSFVSEVLIKVMAFVSRGGAVSILALINAMAVELLPTVVRSLGVGFILMMSRLGGLISPFLLPQDKESFVVCFIVLTVMGAVACLVFLSLPETNKKPLVDTLVVVVDTEEVVVAEKEEGAGGVGGGGGGRCGIGSSGDGGDNVVNGVSVVVMNPMLKKEINALNPLVVSDKEKS